MGVRLKIPPSVLSLTRHRAPFSLRGSVSLVYPGHRLLSTSVSRPFRLYSELHIGASCALAEKDEAESSARQHWRPPTLLWRPNVPTRTAQKRPRADQTCKFETENNGDAVFGEGAMLGPTATWHKPREKPIPPLPPGVALLVACTTHSQGTAAKVTCCNCY